MEEKINEKELYLKSLHDELSDDQCENLDGAQKLIRDVVEELMRTMPALDFVQKPNSPKVSLIKALVSISGQIDMLLTCKLPEHERPAEN